MNVELIVNDEHLDLYTNTALALVLQSQNFNELNEKQSSFSRSFTIPRTDNNNRIIKNIFNFNIADRTAYTILNGVLKVNGIEIGKGNIIVENDGISNKDLRLTFYFNASPFYALVNSIKLSELILDGDHLYNRLNIVNSRIGGLNNGLTYIYPIIDYGIEDAYCMIDEPKIIFDRMLPSTKMVDVKTAIENYTGYKIKGDILNTDNFTHLIIPFSKDKFMRDKNFAQRNNWNTNVSQLSQIILPYTETPFYFEPMQLPIFSSDGLAFMFPDRVKLHIKIDFTWQTQFPVLINFLLQRDYLNYDAWFDQEPGNASTTFISSPYNATIVTTDGVNTYVGNIQQNGCDTGNLPASNFYQTIIEFDIYTLPHSRYSFITDFSSNNTWTLNETSMSSTFISDNNTTDKERLITLGDNTTAWSLAWVSATTPLPDWTISNFIKSISQLFGCIVLCDEVKKEVELYQIKQLYDNINNSYDWSDKIVNIDNAVWNSRANGYGQKSVLKYSNEEYLGTYASYTLLVDDATLPTSADVLQVAYTSNKEVFRLVDKFVPNIKRINRNGEIGGATNQHILYLDCTEFGGTPITYSSPIGLTTNDFAMYDNLVTYYKGNRVKQDTGMFGGIRHFVYINDVGRSGTAPINIFGQLMTDLYEEVHIGTPVEFNASTWIPYCYFNKYNSNTQLGFDTYLYNNYYRYLNYITRDYKQLNVYMRLSPIDITNLDFRKLVYLQQFNSYFFIEKINDWSVDTPTKVELLKLI